MNIMTLKYWIPALAGMTLMSAHAAGETVAANNAWIREAPPGATVMSGYAQLANATKQSIAVTSIRSDAFEKIEIHKSEVKNGVARMVPVNKFEIESRHAVTLVPNGTHLMLIRPKKPLRAGDHVMLHFVFSNGASASADAIVRSEIPDEPIHEHDHQ